MGPFDRGLDEKFIEELNKEYDNNSWWRSFVDDRELFFAIRPGSVNVYYCGCSLLQWEANAPTWKIHYKYLLRPEIDNPYVEVAGGKPLLPEDMKGFFNENMADLKSLKRAARPYAGKEKIGVHNVIMANENIVDVEMQLGSDRVDFVALQETVRGINLVFFEAKHFANDELRAEGKPKVVEQVGGYASMLSDNCKAIKESYSRVCANLTQLRGLAGRYPKRHEMMKRIADRPQDLFVDKNPRLVVFGFDGDQKNGPYWKPHLQKLKAAIEGGVLLKGDSREFRTGISTRD